MNTPRLAEEFAAGTMFALEPALGCITCAQLFVGKNSKLTIFYGMKTESGRTAALQGFIRDNGAP